MTDDEILEAQRMIVQLEGVFCEPASAAVVAGVRKLAGEGRIGQTRSSCASSPGTG